MLERGLPCGHPWIQFRPHIPSQIIEDNQEGIAVKRNREFATGLGLILCLSTVSAQQDTAPPPEKSGDDQKEQPAEAAPKQEMPTLSVGYADWGLRGNSHKFLQYATPARGLFIRQFRYAPSMMDLRHQAVLDARAPFEDDYRLTGQVRLNYGGTYAELSDSRSRFYDPVPLVIDQSQRYITEGFISHKVTPSLAVSFRGQMDQQDKAFEPPLNSFHQRTRTWNAAIQGTVGQKGFVDASYTDLRYWDRTDVLPDTETQRWSLGYSHQVAPNLNLSGSLGHSRIHQNFGQTNTVNNWSIGGQWNPTDSTMVMASLQNASMDLPSVDNGYVRRRGIGKIRVVQRWENWSAQLSFTRSNLERLTDDHLFIETPKWNNWEGSITGRLTEWLRVTGRFTSQRMENRVTMQTEDPRALYWTSRSTGQVKLDASSEFLSGYFIFGGQENHNGPRNTTIRNQNFTFGATWQARPELELYFESSTDNWSASTPDAAAGTLRGYFPDGTTITVGGAWALAPNASLVANYTRFVTNNDNVLGLRDGNVRGSMFTGTFRYQVRDGLDLSLTYAPWSYTDRVYSPSSYNSGFLSISASLKF